MHKGPTRLENCGCKPMSNTRLSISGFYLVEGLAVKHDEKRLELTTIDHLITTQEQIIAKALQVVAVIRVLSGDGCTRFTRPRGVVPPSR